MLVTEHVIEDPGRFGFGLRVFSFEKELGCTALGHDKIRFECLKIEFLSPFRRILVIRQPWTDPVLDTDPEHPAIFPGGRLNSSVPMARMSFKSSPSSPIWSKSAFSNASTT